MDVLAHVLAAPAAAVHRPLGRRRPRRRPRGRAARGLRLRREGGADLGRSARPSAAPSSACSSAARTSGSRADLGLARERLAEQLRELKRQHDLLEHEQRRSERLLLNILPRAIAERLKDEEHEAWWPTGSRG